MTKPPHPTHARSHTRRGSVLVEFALIALLGYVLLAAVLSFGRLYFAAQTAQQAVDLAARELARTPLPASLTFEQVRDDPTLDFRDRIYSEDFLVIDVSGWTGGVSNESLMQFLDKLNIPIVNKALVPLMFIEPIGGVDHLRYPGALVTSPTAPSGLTVEIPYVSTVGTPGAPTAESIQWVRVIEEVGQDPFPVTTEGLVALRINYPFQSATLTGFRRPAADPTRPNASGIEADDAGVTGPGPSTGGTLVDPNPGAASPYAGPFGLGKQLAYGREIRPFRRLISAQAFYRREVLR